MIGQTKIEGTLNSALNTTFRLEFFSNTELDPSGHGEGETYIGSTDVRTDANGDVSFSVTLPVVVPPGHFITATPPIRTATRPSSPVTTQCTWFRLRPTARRSLLRLEFDRPLDEQIASDPSHYVLSGGLAVLSVEVVPDSRWID